MKRRWSESTFELLGSPGGNAAEQSECSWNHVVALEFYSESLDKFGTLWERGKFWVASPLNSCWLSIRPVEKTMGFAEVCVLLEMLYYRLCSLGWWCPRVTAMNFAVVADGEHSVISELGNLTMLCCGLHWLKWLFSKIFHPKLKFGF